MHMPSEGSDQTKIYRLPFDAFWSVRNFWRDSFRVFHWNVQEQEPKGESNSTIIIEYFTLSIRAKKIVSETIF